MPNTTPMHNSADTPTPTTFAPTIGNVLALPPTLTVDQAAEILGCGRSLAYELIRRGDFPCSVLRLGNRRYVIPTADLLRVVGIGATEPQTAAPLTEPSPPRLGIDGTDAGGSDLRPHMPRAPSGVGAAINRGRPALT